MLRKSPVTVQQWVDSIPPSHTRIINENNQHNCHSPKLIRGVLAREASIQSDDVSLCSSLESMLELRRPDPEAVLLGLGFGPSQNTKTVSRIPQRFLNPSKLLKDIDIQKFLEQQGEPPIQGGG
ncbi:hypothetical protein RI129_005400 [Pyrocoelia pectoralis]|uniref:ITPR-interacting domain-containing protein n=1 Tax=Pyrocoelia pectoralis TaxID=417401 RepID=A0AAN7VKT9_9COLE